jgi:hypothetical protein
MGGDGISKEGWGAGFTDTRVMNKCLLAKWLVKIERGDDTMCCNLQRKKYVGEKGIYSYKKRVVLNSGWEFFRLEVKLPEGWYILLEMARRQGSG